MRRTTSGRTASRRKDVTHERIVDAAARAIRRSGYAGTGVADIMKDAGLTHGGFYAHFASREAMLAEAADRAGAETHHPDRRRMSSVPVYEELSHKDMMVIIRNRHEDERHRDDARSAELQCKEGRTV